MKIVLNFEEIEKFEFESEDKITDATGKRINTTVVLITTVEMRAVVIINPQIIFRGEKPKTEINSNAIFLCSPDFSIANAIINMPKRRTIIGCMYSAATSLTGKTLSTGSNPRGNNAVA